VILLDTVGFISKLPHQLVAAFKATLEETVRANLILHVLDAGAPDLTRRYRAVLEVLTELQVQTKESLAVLNKVDLLDSANSVSRLANEWSAVPIAAATGVGIDQLCLELQQRLDLKLGTFRFLLPFSEAGLLDQFHRNCRVLEEDYSAEGVKVLVELEQPLAMKYQRYILSES
jgi:GTPase